MNKETVNKLPASDIVNRVNSIPGLHLERLYQARPEYLTQAAFVEMLSRDPGVAERWFDFLENKAQLDAQNSRAELIKHVAVQDYRISSFSYHLTMGERDELDTLARSMNQARKRSTNGLIGALMRHHLITRDMIGSDGRINIPEDKRIGLLTYAHGFKLSERSVKNFYKREPVPDVVSMPEIPAVETASSEASSQNPKPPWKSKGRLILSRIFRSSGLPSEEAVYP